MPAMIEAVKQTTYSCHRIRVSYRGRKKINYSVADGEGQNFIINSVLTINCPVICRIPGTLK